MARKITIAEASRVMGKSQQYIRLCLQSGDFKFGIATKRKGSTKWDYYISPKLFYDYVGREGEEQ